MIQGPPQMHTQEPQSSEYKFVKKFLYKKHRNHYKIVSLKTHCLQPENVNLEDDTTEASEAPQLQRNHRPGRSG